MLRNNSILIGGEPVLIKISARSKRIVIRIRHGKIELIVPPRASIKKAVKFLHSKEGWITAKLKNTPAKVILNIGTTFPLFGEKYEIVYNGIRGKTIAIENKLYIYGDQLSANKKIKKFLCEKLKTEIETIAAQKSKTHNLTYNKISIRNNISRWGSCSTKGNLSFCWRLVFAPYEITEYLVCHELAHLREMNHSPKFWAVVAALYPDYKNTESWLKKNGNSLYLYD